MPADPFTFEAATTHTISRAAFQAARPLLSWLLGVGMLREIYEQLPRSAGAHFAESVLEALRVTVECDPEEMVRIPASGPLIVAANHPHGALDGLALTAALRRVRPDVRVLANHLLARIPELAATCFFVDPFEGRAAAARSLAGLRAAHLWLRQGGALIVFPSGEVSPQRINGQPVDSAWRPTIGRLALNAGAAILPAHIAGANSRLFYVAGRVHPLLRTALLPRELLQKRGERVCIRFGEPCAAAGVRGAPSGTAAAVSASMRRRVDQLAARGANPDQSTHIAAEIAALPTDARLSESGAFEVFCAESGQIPNALREIGRLRAVTYRAAGEGSGLDVDLDRFDRAYLHLFAWDPAARQIVGAYRIGRTDRLVAEHGVEALYTRILFEYGRELVDRMAPALELGRSFVREEYQRHPLALLALWKGIGAFVVRHPEYRFLFGPVSISARHSDATRTLLAAFLEQNHLEPVLAAMVKPVHPRAITPPTEPVKTPASVDEANRLVASIEGSAAGMPVLLRQYLKLNARLIGFNVDPAFGDVLDALMLVDLTKVDRAILTRYLGRSGAAAFLAAQSTERRAGAAA